MDEDGWYLEGLETAPKFRRKGCAKQLLNETIERLRGLSARSIISIVDQDNMASRALHESCGFENAGGTAKDLEGNAVEGCILYRYSFEK
jgi:L-amino acid N-acyltransferase YncA